MKKSHVGNFGNEKKTLPRSHYQDMIKLSQLARDPTLDSSQIHDWCGDVCAEQRETRPARLLLQKIRRTFPMAPVSELCL
jgi:hypothetical protein